MSLRPVKIIRPFLRHAEGSCLFQMGNTRVLCAASIDEKVPPHAEEKGIGWVTAEYAMLPRAGDRRTPRSRASGGGRAQEISRLVGRSLRAVVDLAALGRHSITIDCDVIEADAGTRTASINGGFIALADALSRLWRQGKLLRWPLKDSVCAVSVALQKEKVFVDPTYETDRDADVDMNVVLTGSGRFVEIQGAAEGAPFGPKDLEKMLDAARAAARRLTVLQMKTLKSLGPPER
jgi:ribonuclease PH